MRRRLAAARQTLSSFKLVNCRPVAGLCVVLKASNSLLEAAILSILKIWSGPCELRLSLIEVSPLTSARVHNLSTVKYAHLDGLHRLFRLHKLHVDLAPQPR